MQVASMHFKPRASEKLADPHLRTALDGLKQRFVPGRAAVIAELDNFEAIRETAAEIRNRSLQHLDFFLEEFERRATACGAQVHWAETWQEANEIVLRIARANGVRKAVKSKSMVSEECSLNTALEAAGIEVVETDLGEYILQLADEPPSHIIAPVIHKTRDQVSDLFAQKHATARKTDIEALTREAREKLRPHFVTADMGITGANFIVAETGSTLIVTNEGNGRMATTLPRIHVAITGIEKVVPTLEDVATLLRLLPRSATGQSISNYVSVTTGPRRAGDLEGPEQFHVVLLDAGRSRILASEFREILRCIRCGACMNHCPVYQSVGGHAYGWVYPGPMGSVLTPNYVGIENALDLPHAATLCNQCGVVCPVKIPLPELLRKLREKQYERRLRPWLERLALSGWAYLAARPRLYACVTAVMVHALAAMGGKSRRIRRLPGAKGWSNGRDMPAPAGRTFRALYAERYAGRQRTGNEQERR